MILLMDADVLAYKAALAVQTLTEPKPGCFRLYANGNRAVTHFEEQVEHLYQRLEGTRIIMALSDGKNFRKKVLPSYKAQRQMTIKPLALKFVRKHIEENYETHQYHELEGDDVLGILGTSDTIPGPKCIVSIDKDFNTVPGLFYNQDKDDLKEITEDEADYYHMYQTLIGDTCDGYSGVRGIGDVTATRLLAAGGSHWRKVVQAFESAGMTEADALVQARCARILRASDYCLETKTIKLWEPKKEEDSCH